MNNNSPILDEPMAELTGALPILTGKRVALYFLLAFACGVVSMFIRPYLHESALYSIAIHVIVNIYLLYVHRRTIYKNNLRGYIYCTLALWTGFFFGIMLLGSRFWDEVLMVVLVGISCGGVAGRLFVRNYK